jgi:hypothetical protein
VALRKARARASRAAARRQAQRRRRCVVHFGGHLLPAGRQHARAYADFLRPFAAAAGAGCEEA